MTFKIGMSGIGLALCLALAMTGCTTVEEAPTVAEDVPTNFYFDGKFVPTIEIDDLRRDLGEYIGADLTTENGRSETAQLLNRIDAGEIDKAAIRETYKGIGGFYARILARAAATQSSTAKYPKLSGKIRRYVYNRFTKSGYLEVDTRLEMLRNGTVTKTKFWWSIAVLPGTYQVFERVDAQPNNPFPDSPLALPPESLEPDNDKGIWVRNLDHKLYAHGAGIVVLAVTKDGVLLGSNDPIYQSDGDSCIDILFSGPPPEQTLPPQGAYCLGRCAHPMIVNTGM